jgi:uncharacterized protein (TIGR02145 family)
MKRSIIPTVFVLFIITFYLHSCIKAELPTLSTLNVYNITATTASSGGNITLDGGAEVTSRGVCWSENENPTTSNSKTINGSGTGQFVCSISGLIAGSTYHVRAFATNAGGTAYGADMSFTTLGQVPEAITQSATNISSTGANLNGVVNARYISTEVTFEYGTSITYGSSSSASPSPVTGNSNTTIIAVLTGLAEGTTYHFRLKTVNSLGITYGNDLEFKTLGQIPTSITQAACCILTSGAKLNGLINPNYISTIVTFEYGTTTAYGNYVTATINPVTGNNFTSVSANLSELKSGTKYHFRLKAVNSLGISYGNDMEFTTLPSPTQVTDIDGNIYNTVIIGTQVWMAENLKTTKFRNGELISTTFPATLTISGESTPKYQWAYDGDESNAAIYGRLYTWYAVSDNRNICPTGWHVGSDTEWAVLINYLGGAAVAGSKLKEVGTIHWLEPNTDATNVSGFTALPGGLRNKNGNFGNPQSDGTWLRDDGNWWSSTEYDNGTAWNRVLSPSSPNVTRWNYSKAGGLSVRCVKE